LVELLKECSAYIRGADGTSTGTGVFIDQDIVLTCAHVVAGQKDDAVHVTPFKRKERAGRICDVHPTREVDLALVRVDLVDGESPLDAAVVGRSLAANAEYFAVGYPIEPLIGNPGIESRQYRGSPRQSLTGEDQFLMLEGGQALIPRGMSGGGLLSAANGAVVANMQYTLNPEQDSGGAAIPVGRAAQLFPMVKRCIENPPIATQRWRELLGQDFWIQLGHTWEWRQGKVDVFVSGSPSEWKVRLDPDDGEPCSINSSTLPPRISEALFLWAQRRRLHNVEDIQLLGGLLGAAVFPGRVLTHLKSQLAKDHLLVRLIVDCESSLIDVPWEFVIIPTHDGRDLRVGTARSLSLVRVGAHPESDRVDRMPIRGKANALAVIVQPDNWRTLLPNMVHGDQTETWPELKQLEGRFRDALEQCKRLNTDFLINPTGADLQRKIDESRFEIFHYVGFCRLERSSTAEIALSNGSRDGIEWSDHIAFFEKAAGSQARILILEFLLPPRDRDYEPMAPKFFIDALRKQVNAVVYNRYHLHPQQINSFNHAFYRALGEGKSVEEAVQVGRGDVMQSPFHGDNAAFGWFTLLTGPTANERLFYEDEGVSGGESDQPRRSAEPKPRQAAEPHREPLASQRPSTPDEFTR
jgi:hypothetical protein